MRRNRGESKAGRLYKRFHGKESKRASVSKTCEVPERVFRVGEALQVLYRSDKLNPETLEDEGTTDYFHDHEGGVKAHLVKDDGESSHVLVPKSAQTDVLVVLGKCLGFTYRDNDGEEIATEYHSNFPELCATPDGRALFVVRARKTIIAIFWGGTLGVRQEGIVG